MIGDNLDFYLSRGYFRMQQDVFTCQFVQFNDTVYAVQWLRIRLAKISYGPSQRRLLRINARFSVVVKPFVLTAELKNLYAQYRSAIDFDAPPTIEACLLDGARRNVFDTQVVEVRDGDRLIAAGIFDNAPQSIMGVMNFYHFDYRKQSLGKFLMLQKINYALAQKKRYYYPGYVVYEYPKFDYKLFPCLAATEVRDSLSGAWLPFSWDTMTQLSTTLLDEYKIRDESDF